MFRMLTIVIFLFSAGVTAETEQNDNKIYVGVCSLLPSASISEKLDSDLYQVEIINVPESVRSQTECEAIWVGIDVPFKNAIEVITSSTKSGIVLRYIGVHGDYDYKRPPDVINRTITIGASTKAAIDQGLKKLDEAELKHILAARNDEQFHEYIRETYSVISKRNWVHRLRN